MERLAQCHCGSLRATTSSEPSLVAICHCKACQRRTGAVAATVAGFAKAQVTIEGETRVFDREVQSGSGSHDRNEGHLAQQPEVRVGGRNMMSHFLVRAVGAG